MVAKGKDGKGGADITIDEYLLEDRIRGPIHTIEDGIDGDHGVGM